MMSVPCGRYQVRILGIREERILHAPKHLKEGAEYDLEIGADGTLRYIPVR